MNWCDDNYPFDSELLTHWKRIYTRCNKDKDGKFLAPYTSSLGVLLALLNKIILDPLIEANGDESKERAILFKIISDINNGRAKKAGICGDLLDLYMWIYPKVIKSYYLFCHVKAIPLPPPEKNEILVMIPATFSFFSSSSLPFQTYYFFDMNPRVVDVKFLEFLLGEGFRIKSDYLDLFVRILSDDNNSTTAIGKFSPLIHALIMLLEDPLWNHLIECHMKFDDCDWNYFNNIFQKKEIMSSLADCLIRQIEELAFELLRYGNVLGLQPMNSFMIVNYPKFLSWALLTNLFAYFRRKKGQPNPNLVPPYLGKHPFCFIE